MYISLSISLSLSIYIYIYTYLYIKLYTHIAIERVPTDALTFRRGHAAGEPVCARTESYNAVPPKSESTRAVLEWKLLAAWPRTLIQRQSVRIPRIRTTKNLEANESGKFL